MRESDVTEQLDRDGLLDAARGPGVYAIDCAIPDDLESAWDAVFDQRVLGFARLRGAETLVYVGASGHVYDRLCEHARGDTRRAEILRVCPPQRVRGVEPTPDPFERERGYALELRAENRVCWYDGEVL